MILSGKPVADALREEWAERIDKLAWQRTLTVWMDNTSDMRYFAAIQKAAEQWKVRIETGKSPMPDSEVDGVPKTVIDLSDPALGKPYQYPVNPNRMVDGQDGIHKIWSYDGRTHFCTPCTAEAVMRVLDYYNVPLEGKNALVIGRSDRVGKPVAMLLLARNSTITVCHSHTQKMDLNAAIALADIVICASGKRGLIDYWTQCRYLDPKQTIVNVGGDYLEKSLWAETSNINLVPYKGGVGPVTAAVLMSHVLR